MNLDKIKILIYARELFTCGYYHIDKISIPYGWFTIRNKNRNSSFRFYALMNSPEDYCIKDSQSQQLIQPFWGCRGWYPTIMETLGIQKNVFIIRHSESIIPPDYMRRLMRDVYETLRHLGYGNE